MKKKSLEMPMLRAYQSGEITAQSAINHAEFFEEAMAIIRESNYRRGVTGEHT